MKVNSVAIKEAKPLAEGERASVPATAAGSTRYLFAVPKFAGNSAYEKDRLPAADETLTLRGVTRPMSVTLVRDGSSLTHGFDGGVLTIELPASRRTTLVDVVRVQLTSGQ